MESRFAPLVILLAVCPGFLIAGNTPSAVSLASSPNASVFGHAVTLTATVTPAAATGTVTFYDGAAFLGTAKLSGGHATLTVSLLPALAQPLRAHYGGDSTYASSTSATVIQTVNTVAGGDFQSAGLFLAGGLPQTIVAADFNGDGKVDLAVVGLDNNLDVLLGNGNGTFQKAVNYVVNGGAFALAVGDLNGDGVPDLAVANNGPSVSVFLGTGNGGFGQPSSFQAGIELSGIAIADFDGDGKADVVTTDIVGQVHVLLGDGSGGFGGPLTTNAGSYPRGLATGDFNGDGKPDVAVVDLIGGSINVLIGNGDGTFQPFQPYQTGAGTWAVAAADLNGDGKTDLAVISGTGVNVLLGNSNGTFTASGPYTPGTNYSAIAVGDWNGDGKADLVALNGNADTANVLPGIGGGVFQAGAAVAIAGDYPGAVAVADFDGDGRPDLAVLNQGTGDIDVVLNSVPAPDLSVTVTHIANSLQGQTQGIQYLLTVSNLGSLPTSGAITVTDTLPTGFTANFAFGTGWSCTTNPVSCTRNDPLGAYSSFPAITILVTAAVGSPNASTNTVSVSGGGETNTENDTASDYLATFSQSQINTAWTSIPMPSGLSNSQAVFLMTDGSAIVQQYCSGSWFKLSPDAFGNYATGTWTQLASMPSGYAPDAYASAVLADGRLVVTGGEYNAPCDGTGATEVTLGAVYDPKANAWTSLAPPSGWLDIGDAPSTVLPNGQFLLGASYNPGCCQFASLNPATLAWTLLPGTGKSDDNEEEGWTLLPDGSVLTIDTQTFLGSERYLPQSGTWVSAGTTPVQLISLQDEEIGPQLLRPDGTVFVVGGSGHTAIFNSATGVWSAGPDMPFSSGRMMNGADAPVALLPDGNALFAAGGSAPNSYGGGNLFEFDGSALHAAPPPPNGTCGFLLPLPNGQTLCSGGGSLSLYNSGGNPQASWAPTIGTAPNSVSAGQTYTVSGTQFNGLSQAVGFGDDYQAATNYPLVRIVNTASKHVFYCRTHNHSSMGVATGTATVSTEFDVPAAIEAGPSTLVVVANGIPSQPVNLIVNGIEVTPALPTVAKGATQQFAATQYSGLNATIVTGSVTWSSGTPSVATITSGGLATVVATNGSSTITATLGAAQGSTTITVAAPTLQSIAVTPANPTVAKGQTLQFAATGTYSDNSTQNLTASVTWASATPSVATINSAGVATVVAGTGMTTITATLGAVQGSTTLTATILLQSIAVTPANPTVAKGLTRQFTATGTFSDGSTQNLAGSVTWASGTTSVATISSAGLATVVASSGTSSITATFGPLQGSTTLTAAPPALVSIAVTPANPTAAKGSTQQFTATGTYSDSSTQNLAGSVTWASVTTSVATISSAGLATVVASSGTSSITATFGPLQGSTTLTAAPPALVSIAVTPANPTVVMGSTRQFTATGTYSDSSTQNLTGSVTWVSGTTSVATIASGGLATVVASSGTSSITATLGSVQGSTTLTAGAPPVLQSIAVTPANPTVSKGLTQQFTATGTFSDNSTQNLTGAVTWASGTTSVATITSAGLVTVLASSGTSSITATVGAVQGSTTLTAAPKLLQSITVTPANPTVPEGRTQQFTATANFSDGTQANFTTSATWTSGTTSVATISSAGLATVVAAIGTSTITATVGSLHGSTTLTASAAPVLQSITVTPANSTVAKGLTQQFTATGTYSDNSTQNITGSVVWSSGTTSVATITSGGLATVEASTGTSSITATSGAVQGSTTLTAAAPVLQSIAVTPANPMLAKGLTQQFTATGTYSDNSTQNLTGSVIWASGTSGVTTITSGGLATVAAASGTSSITATLGAVHGSTTLTAEPASLQSIAVTPANPTVAKGLTQQFTATGTYSDNSTQNLTASVTWESGSVVANITNGGLATVLAASGTSSITATSGAVQGSTTLTAAAPALQSIAVTPANPAVPKGSTQQFTATGTYSDNSTQNLTGSVTWASGTTSVATITNGGLATVVGSSGTSSITATLGVVHGSATLTVGAPTLQSIALTPANPTLGKGQTQQFTATGTYSDGSTQNVTSSVTWGSLNQSAAIINPSGVATAEMSGTSTITATIGSVVGSTVLTSTAATLLAIQIWPGNPPVTKGQTMEFTANGIYSDNTERDVTSSVTWSSGTPAVATIAPDGTATAVAVGSSTITATWGVVQSSTTMTVTNATLVSIALTPANPILAIGATQQLTATATFSDNTVVDITAAVYWATASGNIGLSTTGLVSGAATGTALVGANYNHVTGKTTITVTSATLTSIAVTPASSALAKGLTQQFTAMATFSDNTTSNVTSLVGWESGNPGVVAMAFNGLATVVAPSGTATISAIWGGVTGSTTLTALPAILESIGVTPANPSIAVGQKQQLTATGTYSDGAMVNLNSLVTWNSATPATASISSTGLATAAANGVSTITAMLGAVQGSTLFTVAGTGPCDVQQTGAYTVPDVQQMINEVLGTSPPRNTLHGNGMVNVSDVQTVVQAVVTGSCVTQ